MNNMNFEMSKDEFFDEITNDHELDVLIMEKFGFTVDFMKEYIYDIVHNNNVTIGAISQILRNIENEMYFTYKEFFFITCRILNEGGETEHVIRYFENNYPD